MFWKKSSLTNVLQSYLFFKDKGKTTLAGLLKGQPLGSHHLLGVQRHDIELPPKGTLLKLFKVAYILGLKEILFISCFSPTQLSVLRKTYEIK